ncbi:MAG: response regulator transcription factor [Candidatus Dormibacteraeota bacterium]|nr:response regulator transcription factor [Candidatus Dormibacteraeota bacterium]
MPSRSSLPRIFVVEANPGYRSVISHVVELAGAQFESAAEFDHTKRQFDGTKGFDMIIVGTSAASPFTAERVRKLRTEAQCPLIVLVESYDETKDTLEIYKAGADEVLPKPFVPDALIGAITAAMRRPGPVSVIPLAKRIELGGLAFDAELRRVTGREHFASFTKREWQLLTFFLASPNQFFTAAELASQAWGPETSVEQFRSYVTRLRRKLSPFASDCEVLTEKGKGYCLAIQQAAIAGA